MRHNPAVSASLLAATIAAAQAQSPAPADGRIVGHVITSVAELVPDAAVTLARISESGVRMTTLEARTDASGAFVFDRVPSGRYQLIASKQGHTSRQPAAGAEPRQGGAALFAMGPVVDLDAGEQRADLQIVLYRAASISGRIIGPDGSAAPDVQVHVVRRSEGRTLPLLETLTRSQPDGRYQIDGLPPGEFMVVAVAGVTPSTPQSADAESFLAGVRSVLATDTPPTNPRSTWYPGVADAGEAAVVTLLEGIGAEGIDIWLTPAQRFNVSGRVFWPVGTAVESIAIDYGDPAGTRSGLWLVSDPGGLFTIGGVARGSLTLLARAETDQGLMLGLVSTEVTVDSVEDVRIAVDRPGSVAGRVTYDGSVPASQRAASIAADQKLLKVSALYPVPESTVDSSGRFALRNMIGEYEFSLAGLGPGLAIRRIVRDGVPMPMNRITVSGGEVVDGLEIVVGLP